MAHWYSYDVSVWNHISKLRYLFNRNILQLKWDMVECYSFGRIHGWDVCH